MKRKIEFYHKTGLVGVEVKGIRNRTVVLTLQGQNESFSFKSGLLEVGFYGKHKSQLLDSDLEIRGWYLSSFSPIAIIILIDGTAVFGQDDYRSFLQQVEEFEMTRKNLSEMNVFKRVLHQRWKNYLLMACALLILYSVGWFRVPAEILLPSVFIGLALLFLVDVFLSFLEDRDRTQ